MVGQEVIKSRLFSQSLVNTHNSMLFLGEKGCGKHTLANELATHYGLPIFDITNNISYESIEQIYMNPTQCFYLINMDDVLERQQNVLLKFIEEPLPTSYVILISSSKTNLLETIVNRCTTYEFVPYTQEELKSFIVEGDVDDVLSLCTTPGQIKLLDVQSLNGLHTLCETILDKLGKAKYPNALSIAKKINYKDEYDKFDFSLFLNCLKKHLVEGYLKTNSKLFYDMYNIVVKECGLLNISNINKEYFVEHLITCLWERSKDETK